MRPKRRMGPENAATRTVLMDAVEEVMRQSGYAAVSARSVAAQAGLKYQLVFYYFETMDELLVSTYRRNLDISWARMEAAIVSERPLHALWDMWAHPTNGAVWLEFMALANHNPLIREEKAKFSARVLELTSTQLDGSTIQSPNSVFTPIAIGAVLSCIGGMLAFEGAHGAVAVHDETRALVDWSLDQLEPPVAVASAKRKVRA